MSGSGGRTALHIAVLLLVVAGLAFSAPFFPERFSDLRAFYCAGAAVRAHADPYREHPLSECERGVSAPGLSPLRSGVAVPAPFPGYALALFAALAALPFGAALALWLAASAGALTVTSVLVARITNTPLTAAVIVIAFPAVVVALPAGQLTPFVLFATAGSARLLQLGRPRLAAFSALGALLDPHAGLAVILGLAAGAPRARGALAAGLAALALAGIAVSGPAQEWEYLRAVLPAHALANVSDSSQFSTANFAYAAGIAAPAALLAGGVWYALALGLGTFAALRLRPAFSSAALVLVPPAFAVFGGTHTHLAQLALAIPAFLLATSAARGSRRTAFAVVTFVAAIPWLLLAPFPLLFPAAAVLAMGFAREMGVARYAGALALVSFGTLLVIFNALVGSHVARTIAGTDVAGNPLAEVAWRLFVLARNTPAESWYVLAKGPTVAAFLILLAVLLHAARRPTPLGREC